MLRQYGALLYESAKALWDLGLPEAMLTTTTPADITGWKLRNVVVGRTFAVYDPDGRSTSAQEYFVAELVPNLPDGTEYVPSTGIIRLDASTRNDIATGSATAIHELMHAVQLAEIPYAYNRSWIIEGLAAAVEPFAPLHPIPSEGFRYSN
jgi:hypothetical protein